MYYELGLGHSLIVVDVIDFQIQKNSYVWIMNLFMTNKFSKNLSLDQTAVAFSLMLSKLCMMFSFNLIQFSLQHQMLRTIFQQGKVVDGSGIQALPRKILNHTKQIYHFMSMGFFQLPSLAKPTMQYY